MSRQTTRAFAAGLLASAILLFGYTQFFMKEISDPNEEIAEKSISQEDYKELEQQVQYWKSEYASLVSEEADEKDEIEQSETDNVIHMELTITEGMTSVEISEQLAKDEIISDANEFNDYLEIKDLQRYIQIGTYVVNSEMSLDEIAKLITKSQS